MIMLTMMLTMNFSITRIARVVKNKLLLVHQEGTYNPPPRSLIINPPTSTESRSILLHHTRMARVGSPAQDNQKRGRKSHRNRGGRLGQHGQHRNRGGRHFQHRQHCQEGPCIFCLLLSGHVFEIFCWSDVTRSPLPQR